MYQKAKGDYEHSDLSERHKLILRWADAMCINPGDPHEELVQAIVDQFSQETILECAVYAMIGLCTSKAMIVLGDETGAGDTVGHGPNRDVQPHIGSVDGSYTAGKRPAPEAVS